MRMQLIVPSLLMSAALAAPLFAQGTPPEPHGAMGGAAAGAAPGAAAESMNPADFQGTHTMRAKILAIKDNGQTLVEANGMRLTMHFPKDAIRNFKKGEQVEIIQGIKPVEGAAGGVSGGAPSHGHMR